jgi:GntR family transcriptional regulator
MQHDIAERIIPPGSILPPEIEICQAYGVGRQTVRQAIARLVDDNLVDRYAGRGTFVRDTAERASFHLDRSFNQHVRDLGVQPNSKTLSLDESIINEDAPPQLQKYLGNPLLLNQRHRHSHIEYGVHHLPYNRLLSHLNLHHRILMRYRQNF